jgi:threonine/homoserine/homoserine lactone efflux protein
MPAPSPDGLALLSSGAVLGLTCGITPGPLFALMLSETLRKGRRAGLAVSLAPLVTDLPIILLTVLVVSGLSRSGMVLGLISVAGGVFVARLGFDTIRATVTAGSDAPRGTAKTDAPESPKSTGLRNAIIANFLNPGPWIYWLTVGAPLILNAWNRSPLLACAYLSTFYIFLSGSMIVLVLVAGRGLRHLNGPAAAWVMRVLGAMLFFFAAYFLYGGLTRLAFGLKPVLSRLFS